LKPSPAFERRMPYNMGVVFSRCPDFWAVALMRVRRMEPEQQAWMGDQQAFCDVISTKQFICKRINGRIYNYPPALLPTAQDASDLAEASIVHYKGSQRKHLLLQRIQQEAWC
jgi:hypothetical protein